MPKDRKHRKQAVKTVTHIEIEQRKQKDLVREGEYITDVEVKGLNAGYIREIQRPLDGKASNTKVIIDSFDEYGYKRTITMTMLEVGKSHVLCEVEWKDAFKPSVEADTFIKCITDDCDIDGVDEGDEIQVMNVTRLGNARLYNITKGKEVEDWHEVDMNQFELFNPELYNYRFTYEIYSAKAVNEAHADYLSAQSHRRGWGMNRDLSTFITISKRKVK